MERTNYTVNETPERSTARADLGWGGITRKGESRSFIEDQLGALVDGTVDAGRFPVDVIYPDLAAGEVS
jgi:hypothetical protein